MYRAWQNFGPNADAYKRRRMIFAFMSYKQQFVTNSPGSTMKLICVSGMLPQQDGQVANAGASGLK
jgi:hypothetical protein